MHAVSVSNRCGASLTLDAVVIGGLVKISEDGMLPHGRSVSVTVEVAE